MNLEKTLQQRSNLQCELCKNEENLSVYLVPYAKDHALYACATCVEQMENTDKMNANHWRCLNDSMWSEFDGVKIMAWRMLNRLRDEGWPQDLLDMMYLEDDILALAKASGDGEQEENELVHKDVNGVILNSGDSVVLIKDLKVKGSSLVAKQGTAVRRISLDHDNEKYIEGKVEGQHIVIITDYVKKI